MGLAARTPAADGSVRLSRSDRRLLLILSGTSFFDGYDRSIVALALPQIRHSFALSQSQASLWLSVLYLGALPALFIGRAADQLGRRRILVWSIVGYTAATAATALAPSVGAYVTCQFVARLFLNAEAAIVWTLAAEELPAARRGRGFGFLAMSSALGTGFGAILFGSVLAPLGLSWRWLYVAGLPPLVAIAAVRRRLPESRRFTAARHEGQLADRWHRVWSKPIGRWLALVMLVAFLQQLTNQAGVFAIDFLQTSRGLSPTAANFMLVGAGLPGIPLMVMAGAASDRHGRRVVGCSAGLISIVGVIAFFWIPGGIPILLPTMSLVLIGQLAAWPVLGSFATELFPTSVRSQAGAWANGASLAGASASLALGSVLLHLTGSLPPTVTALAIGPLIAIGIVAFMFPDTHGRELEEIETRAPRPTVTRGRSRGLRTSRSHRRA